MKQRLVIYLLICFVANLNAQSYPFPTESADWHTVHVSSHCTGGSNRNYYWTEYLGSDTLINEVTYINLMFWPHCIYINAGTHCSEQFIFPDDGINVVGGIREVNSQVLFLKYNVPDSLFSTYEKGLKEIPAGEEIVLFDFNWINGDSVVYPQQNGEPLIFDIISSDVWNGRKRVGLRQRGFPAWYTFQSIEGMGGKEGLFNMYYANLLAGSYLGEDVCFIDNGDVVQTGSCTNQCELVSTDNISHQPLRIYPNPTGDEFTIESSSESNSCVIKIYDLLGRLVYTDSYLGPNESISAVKLGFHGWLYVVRTDFKGINSTGKLLVNSN